MVRFGRTIAVMLALGALAGGAGSVSWAVDKPATARTAKAPININTATAAELAKLKGIGEGLAKAIVSYRKRSGPFRSTEDLLNVKGIGDKKLASIKAQISVQ